MSYGLLEYYKDCKCNSNNNLEFDENKPATKKTKVQGQTSECLLRTALNITRVVGLKW